MTDGARRADLGGTPWAHTRPRRGPLAGRAWGVSGHPGPPLMETLRVYLPHENLRSEERPEKYSAAATGRKTPEREKLSGRQESAGGNSLPEGEIDAIVTAIELDFIVIIIIIISTISTIITAITTSSRCNDLGCNLSSS